MPLTSEQRETARRKLLRLNDEELGLTLPELQEMVQQADAWLDANQASYLGTFGANNDKLTGTQKGKLLLVLAEARI